jgi:hypothetical protein
MTDEQRDRWATVLGHLVGAIRRSHPRWRAGRRSAGLTRDGMLDAGPPSLRRNGASL